MPFTFANPLGFWALLGIPAIILIHFLQQKSVVVKISTLFLLDHLQHQSVKGQKFDRLRSSIPLWLQLLAVLLLTWVLVQPRWMQNNAVQRIAIVIDSSASMGTFREPLYLQLKSELSRLASKVHHTEYIVLDSHRSKQPIYNGNSRAQLIDALKNWQPLATAHDFTPALRTARSLVGTSGTLIMVSDHLIDELAYDAQLLAIGQPTDNVGFAGLQIVKRDDGQVMWKALVRNYSEQTQKRNWLLHTDEKKSKQRSIELAAGQTRSLQGAFPDGSDQITLRMDPDAFALDDQLPIIRPKQKKLSLATILTPEIQPLLKTTLSSLSGISLPIPDQNADLTFSVYQPLNPAPLSKGHGIVFLDRNNLPSKYLKGQIYAEHHPLLDNLNWQGLLARSSLGLPLTEADTPLLWQNKRTLIFLRRGEQGNQLIFNFDLASSNATHLPAFIVTIHRFVESVRKMKVAPSQLNFEISQPINLAFDHSEEAIALTMSSTIKQKTISRDLPAHQAQIRAPAQVGFFQIRQGEEDRPPLLNGATHFADTREADLQQAASRNDLNKAENDLINQYSEQDTRWQLWLLILCAALLTSWHFVSRPTNNPPPIV
ncbi:MAG: BatA and WFA domain-containing protein [Verrucomicrobiota bacterium]